MTDSFDYLVIGAGAAGSVIANRLSEDSSVRVLLVEAGADVEPGNEPPDIRSPYSLSMFNPAYFWGDMRVHFRTSDNSVARPFPQGRIVGGTSAINGMWAFRGTPHDYDEWAALGADGWNWANVLPYFIGLESDRDFSGPLHGKNGPIQIQRQARNEWAPMERAVSQVMSRLGWPFVDDMNGDFRDGCGSLPLSVSAHGRSSAGIAYLSSAVRSRPNLAVYANTTVSRIQFENNRATGALLRRADGSEHAVRANEVVVTAGALQTPLLLMRSGIGGADDLRSLGIDTIADLPGVGQNLQNHPLLMIACFLKHGSRQKASRRSSGATFLRWSTQLEGCAPSDMSMWVRSELTWHALGRRMAALYPVLGRPESCGQVRLSKDSPTGNARVEFNFLSDPRDLHRMVDGVRLAQKLFNSSEMNRVTDGAFVLDKPVGLMRYNAPTRANATRSALGAFLLDIIPPAGKSVIGRIAQTRSLEKVTASDDDLVSYVRENVLGAGHVTGTCRMGAKSDRMSVVDSTGKVHGTLNLRVADASIMPRVPSGNTHLPTVMVAEKISAVMKLGGRASGPPVIDSTPAAKRVSLVR